MPPQPVKVEVQATKKIVVYGLLPTIDYQKVKHCAEDLQKKLPAEFAKPEFVHMLEFKWAHWLASKKKELKGDAWVFNDVVMVFIDDKLVGGTKDFLNWAVENYNFEDFRNEDLYETLRREAYASYLESTNNEFVYLDISIDNEPAGRLLIELFRGTVPKTCENFRLLCTGEKGRSPKTSFNLHYKNQIFHRIVPNGWIQGGDIAFGKGNGGESAFGDLFEDESFAVSHNQRGIVGMANNGRHTNGSQFYITLQPAEWMNKKFVAFGQVIEGSETLAKIESLDTLNQRPKKLCKISDSGVFEFLF